MSAPPRVLIIAGSDSGGGAGIQADIKTVTVLGGFAMTAITALTAQNTLGVAGVLPVPADFVIAQMDAVIDDLGVDVVKIGMIGSADVAHRVADRLERLEGVPIVFDPVMVATSGSVLADEATVAVFGRLMRLAAVSTPNAPELAALTGAKVETLTELQHAALALVERTGTPVLAKGGHMTGEQLTDVLAQPGSKPLHFRAPRIQTTSTHGTGCTLASAIATELGRGTSLPQAVERARAYLHAAIDAAPGFGRGHGPLGHGLGRSVENLTLVSDPHPGR